jgi:hypothetical protein
MKDASTIKLTEVLYQTWKMVKSEACEKGNENLSWSYFLFESVGGRRIFMYTIGGTL